MSIKIKIFLYLVGFCSMLLVLMWLFQVVFLESFYRSIKIRGIKNSANIIAKNIDNKELQTLMDRISESSELCISILNENGVEILSSDVLKDCIIHKMPHYVKQRLVEKTLDNNGKLLEYYNRERAPEVRIDDRKFIGRVPIIVRNVNHTILFSQMVKNENGSVYVIALNSVISPVDATVNTLRVQIYYITAIMLIFSILLALFISKNVAKPIVTINETAKIMAKGNYDVKFHGSGYREIKELSDTMNFAVAELSKVERLRRELIANISHDLRTPLTLISGYAEIMRDLPQENNSENAQIIIDETKRLTALVNDMLDLSKIQSNTNYLCLEKYNLTQSIVETIDRLSALTKKEGYCIEFLYERDVFVKGDKLKISQVLYNLLSNAINFTGEDKHVTVTQTTEKNIVTIKVIDTGDGISSENLPYIWDRYYKSNKTHKRGIVGTGLGLSIVKTIIDLHGGSCGVSSKIGEGSVFWFTLGVE